jgi:hypothetical protein
MKYIFLALLLAAVTARADVVVADSSLGTIVARDGRVELYDRSAHLARSFAGVANASRIVVGGNTVAVFDSWSNTLRLIDLGTAQTRPVTMLETPVDAVFAAGWLFVIERDANSLARIAPDGTRKAISVAADPAFIRASAGKVYVYSRLAGVVQQIDPESLTVTRSLLTAAFASDLELDGRTGYLVFPREALVRTFDLASLKSAAEVRTGAVPIDITLLRGSNAMTAATLAVADPSAKRVWTIEARQSTTEAFARGFVRGFLGLGLFRGPNAEFPTGVDRVFAAHGTTVAWDSVTGALYRVAKSKSTAIARGLEPGAFAITENGVALWQNGRLRVVR